MVRNVGVRQDGAVRAACHGRAETNVPPARDEHAAGAARPRQDAHLRRLAAQGGVMYASVTIFTYL